VSTLHEDWRAAGRTDFTFAYNRNRTTATDIEANPAVLAANGLTLIDHQTIGRATETSPSSKLSLSADHTRGDWGLRATETRWGSFVVPQTRRWPTPGEGAAPTACCFEIDRAAVHQACMDAVRGASTAARAAAARIVRGGAEFALKVVERFTPITSIGHSPDSAPP